MYFRPLPVLSIFAIVSLAILVTLGNWQYGRYSEKLGQEDAPAVPFEIVTATPVALDGKSAQLVYGIVGARSIWRRYVPVEVEGKDGVGLWMYDTISTIEPQQLDLSGLDAQELEAAVFVPELPDTLFSAKDEPERNVWNRRNTRAMLDNLGLSTDQPIYVVEPRQLAVEDPQIGTRMLDNPYAAPKPIDPLPPARHLGYALTWWGLAFALLGVYIAFHMSRGRLGIGSK